MKTPFVFGSGGGGMGGVGGMLRVVAHHSISSARPPLNVFSLQSLSSDLTSPSSCSCSADVDGCSPSHPCPCDVFSDWESIEVVDEEESADCQPVFGAVPSGEEVEVAVSALQQIVLPSAYSDTDVDSHESATEKDPSDEVMNSTKLECHVSSSKSESDWIEPILHFSCPKALENRNYHGVLDAFWLLKRNPSVQRMVISLSSDKAVWDAVMQNAVVQELRDSFYADHPHENDDQTNSRNTDDEVPMKFLRWLFYNSKAKILEIISKIMEIADDLLRPPAKGKPRDGFETTLRSSVMLTIVALLVIVVNRIKGY